MELFLYTKRGVMKSELKNLAMEYGCSKEDNIHETTINNCVLSFMQIRDFLCMLGNILYEDIENQIYAASVRSGFKNMNNMIVALQLVDNQLFVVGYAKEGLLDQKSCKKVFSILEDAAHGQKHIIKKTRVIPIFSFLSILILAVILIVIRNTDYFEKKAFNSEVEQIVKATQKYNEAVITFNSLADDYNYAISITCVDNLNGFPSHIDSLSTVSETFEDNAAVLQSDNSVDKILLDTHTVLEMAEQVEYATEIVKQITAPSETWVMERLQNVEIISEAQAVTEDQNPDGLLNAEGGYSSCIYFTVDAALPDEVPGDTIVEKGTAAGGAVEVYPTLADAEARVEYLSGFDDTILYSGSYAIIGTMVVRVSYKLNDTDQLNITDYITYALTSLNS